MRGGYEPCRAVWCGTRRKPHRTTPPPQPLSRCLLFAGFEKRASVRDAVFFYRTVWCGAVRCGVVRCGAVRCESLFSIVTLRGAARGGSMSCHPFRQIYRSLKYTLQQLELPRRTALLHHTLQNKNTHGENIPEDGTHTAVVDACLVCTYHVSCIRVRALACQVNPTSR